jgi:hypothetical protein
VALAGFGNGCEGHLDHWLFQPVKVKLEPLIRLAVVQPDCTPAELDAAVGQAIEKAQRFRPS